MKYKILTLFVTMIIAVTAFPLCSVFAEPAKAKGVTVNLTNIANDARYVDILVKIDKSSPVYTSFNSENGTKNTYHAKSKLVKYSSYGYISYSMHFKGADTVMKLKKIATPNSDKKQAFNVFIDSSSSKASEQLSLLEKYSPKIKIAVLDKDRKVIYVSKTARISGRGYLTGNIVYSVNGGVIDVDYYTPVGYKILYGAIAVACVAAIFAVVRLVKSTSKRKKKVNE